MLRIATIGTSPITDNLIEVLNASSEARFVGTLSRDAERAAVFTRDHGGDTPFTRLEDLAASSDVDAVYIGSPNGLHATQALELIEHGKHVLVEKPFAANEAAAQQVFDAAQRAGVVAMEAMRPLHDPAFCQVRDALASLGRIRRASIRFGKYSSRYDEVLAGKRTNIFDCAMASGALMDIGIYAVEPMVALFGTPVDVVSGVVLLNEDTRAITGGAIDGAGTAIARYPDKMVELAWSKITNDDLPVQIESEQATLELDSISIPTHMTIKRRGKAVRGDAKATRTDQGGSVEDINLPRSNNTMEYELADFVYAVEAVRGGTPCDQAPAGPFGTIGDLQATTLAALALTDEIRRQAGIVFPFDAA